MNVFVRTSEIDPGNEAAHGVSFDRSREPRFAWEDFPSRRARPTAEEA